MKRIGLMVLAAALAVVLGLAWRWDKIRVWYLVKPGADLSGRDLSGCDLGGMDLRGVSLSGANLRGANLHEVYMSDVDLSDANLQGADLREAIGANLEGTQGTPAHLPDDLLDE